MPKSFNRADRPKSAVRSVWYNLLRARKTVLPCLVLVKSARENDHSCVCARACVRMCICTCAYVRCTSPYSRSLLIHSIIVYKFCRSVQVTLVLHLSIHVQYSVCVCVCVYLHVFVFVYSGICLFVYLCICMVNGCFHFEI